jgi:hypothetical protein
MKWWNEHVRPSLVGAMKSSTVWFSALLASLPDVLSTVRDNFSEVAPYVPTILQPKILHAVAALIFVLRIKTTTSLKAKGQ